MIFPVINFYKRKKRDIKRSCFLLVDVVPEEGPGTEMEMLLGRVGVLVSLPKTISVLSAVTFSGFLLISINIQDNTENMKHYSYQSSNLSQIFLLYIFIYFSLSYSAISFTILSLLSNIKFFFEGSEPPH